VGGIVHFPVYVVLPSTDARPPRKEVESFVEQVLAPYQYIERSQRGSDEPEVVQHGWWDWYELGGSFKDLSHVSPVATGWRRLLKSAPASVGQLSVLLDEWSPQRAPVRIVLPDGTVHGGNAWSEDANERWVEEAREILGRYRAHSYVVVDCHK
jgi:hypothetical protein